MLNEFVSVVISSNEEHRKLMEKTCLFARQRPVALIEVLISSKKKKGKHIRQNPKESEQKCTVCEIFGMVCVSAGGYTLSRTSNVLRINRTVLNVGKFMVFLCPCGLKDFLATTGR